MMAQFLGSAYCTKFYHNSAADVVGMVRHKLSHLLCYMIILRRAKKC